MNKDEEKVLNSSPASENAKPPPNRVSTKRLAVNLAVKIAVIAIAVWLALTFVLGLTINYGNNMHPAVKDGDLVVSLKLQRPYLNAAVLYEKDGKKTVGRVVGLPGNVIDITDNGALLVNGVIPAEEVFYPTYRAENSEIEFPLTVEEGKVFILNDFREDTNDSRTFGTVDMDDLDGPLLFTLRRRGF